MSLNIVVGAQWGDEGKGRIVDLLASESDLVARFGGGDNAGHTVTVGKDIFKLHLVPSGIIHPHTISVLGNGMVINPLTFLEEIESLQASGIAVDPTRLFISYAAHLITPGHRILDTAMDAARGDRRIGTTGRGIGPAYTDKTSRRGIRAQDIFDIEGFRQRLANNLSLVNQQLVSLYQQDPLDIVAIADEFIAKTQKLKPFIHDTGRLVRKYLADGKTVLAEGAQGTLLDLDHGSYPFVTSSTTTAAGVLTGLGIGIQPIDRIIGVTKAFQTRVGSGPFPTEVDGDTALRLRGTGANPWDEFGTTTGRPRRVGWLDGVLLRYAVETNNINELVLTKMDILTAISSLQICTAYRIDGNEYQFPPAGVDAAQMEKFEAVYETLPGWSEDIQGIGYWERLPAATRQYVEKIEEISGVPVRMISVGPERDQVIYKV